MGQLEGTLRESSAPVLLWLWTSLVPSISMQNVQASGCNPYSSKRKCSLESHSWSLVLVHDERCGDRLAESGLDQWEKLLLDPVCPACFEPSGLADKRLQSIAWKDDGPHHLLAPALDRGTGSSMVSSVV